MPGQPFRFLQASDFHLDQPLNGLAEVPDHLVELLADAPYQAAARAFDLALAEEVDFVLLLGGLVDPHRAGPRGLRFLSEQFARLAEREIAVYWVTSRSDGRESWPANLRWPSNLHLFDEHRVERAIHSRHGEPVCQIFACGGSSTLQSDATVLAAIREALAASSRTDIFSIGAVPHKLDPSALADLPVRYWAFGGGSNPATLLDLSEPQRTARLSGSPQARAADNPGPHGCTVVQVDDAGHFRADDRPTDVVRWHEERVDVPATMSRSELDHLLGERTTDIIAAAPDRTLLIRWTLYGEGALLATARRAGLATELISRLRTDFGHRAPSAWTTSIAIEPPALPNSWYEQETLLGDLLRSIRTQGNSDSPLDLSTYLSEQQLPGPLANRGTVAEPEARRSILRHAAWLGADLLHSDDAVAKEAVR
jgi:exonuclease SbcD